MVTWLTTRWVRDSGPLLFTVSCCRKTQWSGNPHASRHCPRSTPRKAKRRKMPWTLCDEGHNFCMNQEIIIGFRCNQLYIFNRKLFKLFPFFFLSKIKQELKQIISVLIKVYTNCREQADLHITEMHMLSIIVFVWQRYHI